jgi:predicted acyltransferase
MPEVNPDFGAHTRLVSVDVFRGATMVAMILVNNPGDTRTTYWPLQHAAWHGWTPTDLVFPFFLFIVGVAIVLSLKRRVDAGARPSSLIGKIFRRSAILFVLGLLLNGYPFGLFGPRSVGELLEVWRIPGVLQRIAVCYLVAAILVLRCRTRTLKVLTVVLVIGYWLLMVVVPVPGQGAPDIDDPGGHLSGWLDRAVFGSHVWEHSKVYDPEGLLSTIPAIATTLFGVLAGLLLAARLEPMERLARLMVTGALLVAAGAVWGWFFPINKPIWTSSYAVFTAGLAFSALGLCYWAVDLRGERVLSRLFVVYGVNAIAVYVGSGVLARTLALAEIDGVAVRQLLYASLFASWLPAYLASLGYAITWVAGWFAVLLVMERRGIYIKV